MILLDSGVASDFLFGGIRDETSLLKYHAYSENMKKQVKVFGENTEKLFNKIENRRDILKLG